MRIWRSGGEDDGSVHCLGNGRLAAYCRGPEVFQVFGPPYSSASHVQLLMDEAETLEARSVREVGTAIWTHELFRGGSPIGEITDFVDSELPCLVRRLTLTAPLTLRIVIPRERKVLSSLNRYREDGCVLGIIITAEPGTFFYGTYPTIRRQHMHVMVGGAARAVEKRDTYEWTVQCAAGRSTIHVIGGPEYPDLVVNTENVLGTPFESLLERTRAAWAAFGKRTTAVEERVPQKTPHRAALMSAVDSVSVLIRAQQSIEGGVIAGHNYHLAYVRDQYGTSRCLLALGCYEEARAILRFYFDIWSRFGRIRNAQAAGQLGVFHIHENDDVEITGYLVVQAFDYLRATGDSDFITEILPMLEWAWRAQASHLKANMLPFNGDETYVAGGVFPRSALHHGSAESTLLFITGGERLLSWLAETESRPEGEVQRAVAVLREVRWAYRANFFGGGKLHTNNPGRMSAEEMPRFRHGVCESCRKYVGWTEKRAYGRYQCAECLLAGEKPAPSEDRVLNLQSVSLTPLYLGSDLLSQAEVAALVGDIVSQYERTGLLPSNPSGGITVGYDYGLLLYSLAALRHPSAPFLYERTMEALDASGAWVEYYRDGKPQGTRCRPWESGINLEAALRFALS